MYTLEYLAQMPYYGSSASYVAKKCMGPRSWDVIILFLLLLAKMVTFTYYWLTYYFSYAITSKCNNSLLKDYCTFIYEV